MLKRASLLLLLLPLLTLVSCKNDDEFIIWDIAPVSIDIVIQDADGNNLLSPGVPGSLYGEDISIEYDGKTYSSDWSTYYESRYYMPHFDGLKINNGWSWVDGERVDDPSKDFLSFGQFDGAENQNISAVLTIPGHSEPYKIDLVHKYKSNNKNLKYDTKIYLNGERISGSTVIIRLPNAE